MGDGATVREWALGIGHWGEGGDSLWPGREWVTGYLRLLREQTGYPGHPRPSPAICLPAMAEAAKGFVRQGLSSSPEDGVQTTESLRVAGGSVFPYH